MGKQEMGQKKESEGEKDGVQWMEDELLLLLKKKTLTEPSVGTFKQQNWPVQKDQELY